MSNNVEVKHLLRYKRFNENEWKFISLLCYLPLGLVLVVLRATLALAVFLLSYILPDVPFVRKILNKITCLSLGISVSIENNESKENADVYVSNSLSLFDHIAVHQATGSISNGPKLQPLLSKSLGIYHFGSSTNLNNFKQNVRAVQSIEKSPLYFAPEGRKTNGKALIKFEIVPFTLAMRVQPVAIIIERPFLDISVSSLGSSQLADVFFYMFSPLTNYKLKFLAVLEKKNLADEAFADVVRRNIAAALGVEAVDFTAQDLVDLEKRQLAEQKRIRSEQTVTSPSGIPALRRMAVQVKEVLPHVPLDVIYKDLYRTRNIDNTITNILEGHVHFIPDTQSTSAASTSSSTSSTSVNSSSSVRTTSSGKISSNSSSNSLNMAASTFSKSANERSRSFQERKEQLIANARRRYIEKHNLDIPL